MTSTIAFTIDGKEVKAVVRSPEKTPAFGGIKAEVTLPPMGSVFYEIDRGKFAALRK